MTYLGWLYGASQVCVGFLLAFIVVHIADKLSSWWSRRGRRGVL